MGSKKSTKHSRAPRSLSPQESIALLRQSYPLLTAGERESITAVSQELQDGDNVYAQSLTGALQMAEMFGCQRSILHEAEFARSQPQLFNVFLGAALALTLNKDMARGHFDILITPLAATKRFAWLKEVLVA